MNFFSQVFPLIYSQMNKEEKIYCRVVCKGWQNSVDKFLQTHSGIRALEPYQKPPHVLSYLPTLIQKGFSNHYFGTSLSIEVFLRDMESHPWNPFITGCLDLSACQPPAPFPQLQWNDVNSLLTQFGKHILQVNLGPQLFDHGEYTVLDCYKLLERTLDLMPNLKRLFIFGFKYYEYSRRVFRFDELVDYINTHPLPELPHLEELEFEFQLCRKTEPVIDELMSRYAKRINTISFSVSVWNEAKEQYKNLQYLRELKIVMDNYFPFCVHLIKSLHAPQLGKVQLTFQMNDLLIPVMMALNDSCPSLTYLKFKFEKKPKESFDFFSRPPFQMNGVKTLEVVESSNAPYDMLLTFLTKLEVLLILCKETERSRERGEEFQEGRRTFGIRKLLSSQDKIYKSKIWTKLPTLEEFTLAKVNYAEEIVSKTQFTRGMYNYLKQDN